MPVCFQLHLIVLYIIQLSQLNTSCPLLSCSQDVDLVHCRIGKIEGLEVLQKAKVCSNLCVKFSQISRPHRLMIVFFVILFLHIHLDTLPTSKPNKKNWESGKFNLTSGARSLWQPDPQTGEPAEPHRAWVSMNRLATDTLLKNFLTYIPFATTQLWWRFMLTASWTCPSTSWERLRVWRVRPPWRSSSYCTTRSVP